MKIFRRDFLQLTCIVLMTAKATQHLVNEMMYYQYEVRLALNLTSAVVIKKGAEYQCMSDCFYKENCAGVNIETIQQHMEYKCHLFIFHPCQFVGFNRYGFVKRDNFKFIYKRKTDCLSLYAAGVRRSGIYRISPNGINTYMVWCDMETNGGGWTVILRRTDDGLSFNKSWSDYKQGFGSNHGSLWLGNDKIHELTGSCKNELLVEFTSSDDTDYTARYFEFQVASESKMYKLSIGQYCVFCNSVADKLSFSNNMKFSTTDEDNDDYNGESCSKANGDGGWWFNACHHGYMTGLYMENFPKGNTWGQSIRVKYSVMKTRRGAMILSEGMPAKQSSTHVPSSQNHAGFGNDGSITTGLAHTYNDQPAWWEVDLLEISIILKVKIFNRNQDCCAFRLENIYIFVRVSYNGASSQCNYLGNVNSRFIVEFPCEANGRYVRLEQHNSEALNFREMQVFGIV